MFVLTVGMTVHRKKFKILTPTLDISMNNIINRFYINFDEQML